MSVKLESSEAVDMPKQNNFLIKEGKMNTHENTPPQPDGFQQKWPEMGAFGRESSTSVLKSR